MTHAPPHSQIVTEEVLMASTGYDERGRLEGHLRKSGIRYFRGRGGRVWTTIGLIEGAGAKHGRAKTDDHGGQIEF